MSAPPPDSGNGAVAETGRGPRSARELELLLEMEALRSENQHLRQFYARHLSTPQDPPDGQPGLPLPLHPQGHTLRGSDGPRTAQLEYEAVFAALARAFPIGIFRTDEAGVLTHVDNQLQQIFGLEEQDFFNFGWMRCVHSADVAVVKEYWERGVATGTSTSLEFRIIRPGSEDIAHVIARNIPQFDEQGRLTGQLGFVQDISQLRKLEAEARIKDELNRQIIASSPDCTKVLDLQGLVLQMTARGCKLVEVDDFEQVRGSDWTTWWPEEGQNLARSALDQARTAGGARFVAFGNTFKGTPKWWDTMISPICDAQGNAVMLSIAYGADQSYGNDLHVPDVCYPAGGFQIEQRMTSTLTLEGNISLPTRRLVAQRSQRREPLTYWVVVGERAVTGAVASKLAALSYGMQGIVPDGMIIRMSTLGLSDQESFAEQDAFAAEMLRNLPPRWKAKLTGV